MNNSKPKRDSSRLGAVAYLLAAAVASGAATLKLTALLPGKSELELFGSLFFALCLPGALWLARAGGLRWMLSVAALVLVYPLALFFFGWPALLGLVLLLPVALTRYEKWRKAKQSEPVSAS